MYLIGMQTPMGVAQRPLRFSPTGNKIKLLIHILFNSFCLFPTRYIHTDFVQSWSHIDDIVL